MIRGAPVERRRLSRGLILKLRPTRVQPARITGMRVVAQGVRNVSYFSRTLRRRPGPTGENPFRVGTSHHLESDKPNEGQSNAVDHS